MGKFKFIIPIFFGTIIVSFAQNPNEIPKAQPGKCYAKCMIPDTYETVNEQVVVKPATTQSVFVPAEYETRTEQILVKDESKRITLTQAVYESQTKNVLIKEASKRLIVVPAVYEPAKEGEKSKSSKRITVTDAVYETTTEQVEIKEASKKLIEVPAVYEDITEQYVIEPAITRADTLKPKMETEYSRIETKPASTKWVKKSATANCLSANPDDCMVWCLVETPPEYQTTPIRVNKGCDGTGVANSGCIKTIEVPAKMGSRTVHKLKSSASVREETVPAEYKTITKRIVKTPATTKEETISSQELAEKKQALKTPATIREEEIPAEYTMLPVQVLKTPASFREEVTPAEYKTVTSSVLKKAATTKKETVPAEYLTIPKRKLVKAGGFTEWREVLCGEKITSGYTIRQIQQALKTRGYDPGPMDNAMGGRTKTALLKFQADKGLPSGNLDMETLKALGINY